METNKPLTPDRIMGMINAFQVSGVLKGAIELGLFTALGRERKSADQLAEEIKASPKGTRVMCDFLSVHGMLEKIDGHYQSSPDAALFLNRNSPAYFGSVGQLMANKDIFTPFMDVASLVRKGGTTLEGQGTVEPNYPMWVQFARDMVPMMMPAAGFIGDLVCKDIAPDQPLKVLDLAAGHGVFGIEIAKRHPGAEIVAQDWAPVLDVATENAKRAGVQDRHQRIEGSAFDVELGSGYDVVLLTNFLHHFAPQTCTDLLKRIHASLNEGGQVITVEFVPNEDRVSPPFESCFSMIMLATTASGDAYTFAELEKMFTDAGFQGSELIRQQGLPQSIVVSRK
jgi:2-polyprenyl-3-methyl-5-hydroxy-6-metoxy-1,4-benzoquinol methylase